MELPCTLRDGLSLEIKRLSWIINSYESEEEEMISKLSKEAELMGVKEELMWEKRHQIRFPLFHPNLFLLSLQG